MDAIPRVIRGLVLRGLIIDFPAMAQQADRQHFLLAISLVNDPVVAHTKLEETGEGPSEGFGLNGVKVLGKPAELLQHAASHTSSRFSKSWAARGRNSIWYIYHSRPRRRANSAAGIFSLSS